MSPIRGDIRNRAIGGSTISSYSTLSDVEDKNDRGFWAKIAQIAAANAINENKAMNIPVTVLEDDWVVRKKMDGSIEQVVKIERRDQATRRNFLKKGTILHVKIHR